MADRIDRNTQLTPEAEEILKVIRAETTILREVELGDVPPATVFEAE